MSYRESRHSSRLRHRLVLPVILIAGLATPASASHSFSCDQADVETISTPAATLYVVYYDGLTAEHDPVAEHYIYLEYNGRSGLQPGGPGPALGYMHGDPCSGEDPDLRLY